MSGAIVLAVDGGNSKTDLALVARRRRAARARARAAQLAAPPRARGCLDVLAGLLDEARRSAGLDGATAGRRGRESCCIAGVDFPREEDAMHAARRERGLGGAPIVGNDTFAVLRAGTDARLGRRRRVRRRDQLRRRRARRPRRSASPRSARSRATGAAATTSGSRRSRAAARSEDGRGPRTSLERAVPAPLRPLDARSSSRRRSTPGDPASGG